MENKAGPPPPGFAPPPQNFVPPQQNYAAPPPYMDPNQQPQRVVIVQAGFGKESQRMNCPNCGSSISTTTETEANSKTHLFALLLCVVGLCCLSPCPYCIDGCLVTKHYCPSCKSYLGESQN